MGLLFFFQAYRFWVGVAFLNKKIGSFHVAKKMPTPLFSSLIMKHCDITPCVLLPFVTFLPFFKLNWVYYSFTLSACVVEWHRFSAVKFGSLVLVSERGIWYREDTYHTQYLNLVVAPVIVTHLINYLKRTRKNRRRRRNKREKREKKIVLYLSYRIEWQISISFRN